MIRKHPLIIVAAGMVLAAASPALAEGYVTGDDLYAWCGDSNRRTLCKTYVAAVVDMIDALQQNKLVSHAICPPVDATIDQTVDIVITKLRAQPEARQFLASSLAWAALFDAWPCPK
jgi:hypothetical protein